MNLTEATIQLLINNTNKFTESKKLLEHTESILEKFKEDNFMVAPFVKKFKAEYPDAIIEKVYLERIEGGWQPCVAYVESDKGTYRVFIAEYNDGIYLSKEDSIKPAKYNYQSEYDYVED